MMNEEELIVQLEGGAKRNPFKTPEGYFDHLAERTMDCLPDANPKRTAKVWRLRPWLYAAAIAGVVAISDAILTNREDSDKQTTEVAYNDTFIDEAADYVMVDNQDIYAYLLADL